MSSILSWKSGSLDPCGGGKGTERELQTPGNVQEKGIVSTQGYTVTALPHPAIDPAPDNLNLWYLFWIYDSESWPKGASSLTCSPRLLFSCCFKSSRSSLPPFLVLVEAELGSWSWNREDAESKSFLSYLPMLRWLHKSWMPWIFSIPKGKNLAMLSQEKSKCIKAWSDLQRSRTGVPLHLAVNTSIK